ncbi:MAG: homoserine O-acetyltransferase [Wenzhouxiangella sp.]|nr:MAG: homoserine O-acetyltransferase [Wenzhouxiangella sp.]
MSDPVQLKHIEQPPPLAEGTRLDAIQVGFRSWGRLDEEGANAVLVCPALTGDSDLSSWWPELLGPGRALDPEKDFIVSVDVLGGSGQTTGPTHPGPDGQPWEGRFPSVTVRDMVLVQGLLLETLGVKRLKLVIGGSLGGMQALEWAVAPALPVAAAVAIAAPARQSAWARALNHIQRRALEHHDDLELARMVAMLSYRHWDNLDSRFAASDALPHPAEQWLEHHGSALKARFDPVAYQRLMAAMDSHDIGRGRGDLNTLLANTPTPVQVIGINSDLLYPPRDQAELAEALPQARLDLLDVPQGHDAFLIEQAQVNDLVLDFRRWPQRPEQPTLKVCF